MVVLVSKDLMIQSNVAAAAETFNLPLQTAVSVERAVILFRNHPEPVLLLLDLQTPGLFLDGFGQQSGLLEISQGAIAFAQHVERELLESARKHCKTVLTRGQFSQKIPHILQQFASSDGP